MSDQTGFWGDEKRWPRDSSMMVFLARAVDKIGANLFGAEWTGEERKITPMLPLVFGDNRTKRRVNNILAQHYPEFKRKHFPDRWSLAPAPLPTLSSVNRGSNIAAPNLEFSHHEFETAKEFVDGHNLTIQPAIRRFQRAQTLTAELAERGAIKTFSRKTEGGNFEPIPPEWWNTERLKQRFDYCQISPVDPFGTRGTSNANCWIFVSRESLETQTAAPTSPRAPKVRNVSGAGKMRRSIQAAYKKLFPSGSLPNHMSSQDRDDLILDELKDLRTKPDPRTIQRAIKALN